MSQIDDLFDGEDAAEPNIPLVATLLATGAALAVLGLACTSIPGGVLVLLGFHYADLELDRVDSGYLPESERPRVQRLRTVALIGVVFLAVVIVAQNTLLCMGFYDEFWGTALRAIAGISASIS